MKSLPYNTTILASIFFLAICPQIISSQDNHNDFIIVQEDDSLFEYVLANTQDLSFALHNTTRDPGHDVLDSFYRFDYNSHTEEWIPMYRLYYSFDFENRRKTWQIDLRDNRLQKWTNTQLNIIMYDELGNFIREVSHRWDNEFNDWVEFIKYDRDFDTDGNLILVIRSIKYPTSLVWHELEKDTSIYNDDGLLESSIKYNWNSQIGWQPVSLINYSYSDSLLIETLYQNWNPVSYWENSYRTMQSYENGVLTENVSQSWDAESNQWVNSSKTSFSSSMDGLVREIWRQTWDSINWVNSSLDSVWYNSFGRRQMDKTWLWDNENSSWINRSQYLYTYDENEHTSEVLSKEWTDAGFEWQTFSRAILEYDNSDSIIDNVLQYWVDSTQTWVNLYRESVEYDEMGRQLYYGFFIWNDSSEDWQLNEDEKWIYNENGDLLSYTTMDFYGYWWGYREVYQYSISNKIELAIYEEWDSDLMRWMPNYRYTYEYDLSDFLVNRTYQFWDTSWINIGRTLYESNSIGLDTLSIYQTWDSTWHNNTRYLRTYNKEGLVSQNISQRWDNSWINDWRAVNTYNSQGDLLEKIEYVWSTDQEWSARNKEIIEYDAENRQILRQKSMWSFADSVWIPNTEYIDAYDANGNHTVDLYRKLTGWVSGGGDYYTYDEDDHLLRQRHVRWGGTDDGWINDYQYRHKYDELGHRVEIFYDDWDLANDQWIGLERGIFTNDINGNPIQTVLETVDEDGFWRMSMMLEMEYDDRGNMLFQNWNNWQWTKIDWVNKSYHLYYYSEHQVTAIEDFPNQQMDCRYANPFILGNHTIACSQLADVDEFNIQLIDLSGRIIYTKTALPEENIQLHTRALSGMYLLIITDQKGQILHRGKMVIVGS